MINEIHTTFHELDLEKEKLKDKGNTVERSIHIDKNIQLSLYFSPSGSKRGLKINLNYPEPKMKFTIESNGFTYKYINDSIYIEEDREYITNIFKVFISELLPDGVVGNKMLFLDTLKKKVLEWRDFFQEVKKSDVNNNLIKGLIGELSYLKYLILNDKITSLNSWSGPNGARSDFFVNGSRIEVKTTTTTNPVKISISNLKQLEIDSDELYFVLYELISNEEGLNLKELIDELESLIEIKGLSKSDFYKKLEIVGCSSEVISITEKNFYKIISQSKYKVTNTFPRLTSCNVPQHIMDVRYSVLKDGIQDFKVNFD
jgi:hypothetical protein